MSGAVSSVHADPERPRSRMLVEENNMNRENLATPRNQSSIADLFWALRALR